MKEPSVLLERKLSAIIDSKAPSVPFYSTVLQDVLSTAGSLGANYWRSNMQSPVLFSSTLTRLLQDRAASSNTILLEIGPHSALAGPIRQTLKSAQATTYIPTLMRDANERDALLVAAGRLFSHGAQVRLEALSPKGRVQSLVPRYPWYRDAKYWCTCLFIHDTCVLGFLFFFFFIVFSLVFSLMLPLIRTSQSSRQWALQLIPACHATHQNEMKDTS